MKKIFKLAGLLLFGIFLFAAYVVWVNLDVENNNEELLASLPSKITPTYDTAKSRNWWKETTVYQIYPRSFKDSDGDGIGDINGIISELDYIQSLGFETIWFSPFFKSPQLDHGYDISDYEEIAAEYGNLNLLDSLIKEVHQRDMKIVFDLVLNHTSEDHAWFQESKSSKDNPKSDWYVWKDGKNGGPPNNWQNILGQESAWIYAPERGQYYYAAFMPFQPDLNMNNPEVRAEIFTLFKYWLDKDVDGFRLDIFNFIFENQNFKDNPSTWRYLPKFEEGKWMFEEHKYNFHQPEVLDFAKELRSILESYPDGRFMVGEVFGSHKEMRELMGTEHYDGLNLVFLFNFLETFEFSADYFREKAMEYEAFYPYPLVPTHVFSNHDQLRSITRLDNNVQKADVLAAFQLTMRGVPFVYQGEEIGMTTDKIPVEEAQDPVAKYWKGIPHELGVKLGQLLNRDNCRTPMQWSAETAAGFSSNPNTWLPVQENYKSINVETQLADGNSLLNTYKDLLKLRNESSVLKAGQITFLDAQTLPKEVLAYQRFNGQDNLRIYLNFSEESKTIDFNGMNPAVKYQKRASLNGQIIELDAFGILIVQDEI